MKRISAVPKQPLLPAAVHWAVDLHSHGWHLFIPFQLPLGMHSNALVIALAALGYCPGMGPTVFQAGKRITRGLVMEAAELHVQTTKINGAEHYLQFNDQQGQVKCASTNCSPLNYSVLNIQLWYLFSSPSC